MAMLPSRGRKGRFICTHPEKYVGDASMIVYRSSLEFAVMRRFDTTESVIAWASEPLVIPWSDSTGRARRYIPDFMIKVRGADGSVDTVLVEVKPRSQSPLHVKSVSGKKRSRRSLVEQAMALDSNRRKWEAAERVCASRGWKFKVLTEQEILGR